MVGWAAVTGDVGLPALVLFALIFFWTPPHFWALALYRSRRLRQGRRADAAGGRRRRARPRSRCWLYTLVLWPVALAPTLLGVAGWLYGAAALALSAALHRGARSRVWRDDRRHRSAKRMFGFSMLYLFLLFALLLDRPRAGLLGGIVR